jgi:UV DNA damage endonuclease
MTVHPYRLGFAVKVLGNGGLKTADTRRWQNRPHLSRSLELLDVVFDYLGANGISVYRLPSGTVPYGTHPDLPTFDYRQQIDTCADRLAALGAKARELGLRLSTHPGQYTVLSTPDAELAAKSSADLEQDALLLDALGAGPEAVVVVHAGGGYGDKAAALDRWARAYERLSERARRRVVVENDERTFDVADVVALHDRTGVRVVFDVHHHRLNRPPGLDEKRALELAYGTWGGDARPKVHLSSPRTELRVVKRRMRGERGFRRIHVAPRLDQHADFVPPWDLAALLHIAPGPLDVMVEAKAKDLAVLALRAQLARVEPDLAAAEERTRPPSPPRSASRPAAEVPTSGASPSSRRAPASKA